MTIIVTQVNLKIMMSVQYNALIETFRFEDENHYEYEIWFKVFSRIL